MDKYIDLHVHSLFSDGSMTPSELVKHAANCNLAAIALTDHDTIDGINEALTESKKIGIEVIPGVELEASIQEVKIHILGYFFDNRYRKLDDILNLIKKFRIERNDKIISELNSMGVNISSNYIYSICKNHIIAKPNIAYALVTKGYANDYSDALNTYLGKGRPAYVESETFTAQKLIAEIAKSGGISVIAHPKLIGLNLEDLEKLIKKLISYGLNGIEVYYSKNTEMDTYNSLKLAQKYDLIATGGSDFHGTFTYGVEIGKGKGNLKIPFEIISNLKNFYREKLFNNNFFD